MDVSALATAIDNFNQKNDPFAIGMNFAVAGIGSLQEFIKEVERGTVDVAQHAPLLDNAEQMIAFGLQQMQAATKDRAIIQFLERYRAFVAELRKMAR